MTELFLTDGELIKGAPFGYVDRVNSWKDIGSSEANRIMGVTSIAAVSRGKDESNNPTLRYQKLLEEAAPKYMEDKGCLTRKELFCMNWFTDISLTGNYVLDYTKLMYFPDNSFCKGMSSRALEFVPVVLEFRYVISKYTPYVYFTNLKAIRDGLSMKLDVFNNVLGKFGHIEKVDDSDDKYRLLTNMRAVLNTGLPYEMVPYLTNQELADRFKIIKMKIPMFVFNHLVTHTQFSKITQSDRVSEQNDEYWLPSDFINKTIEESEQFLNENGEWDYKVIVDVLTKKSTINEVRELLKNAGYKKEIWQRALLEFRYKTTIFAGWDTEHTWVNLLFERGAIDYYKTWAQQETKIVAKAIMKEIGFTEIFAVDDSETEA